MNYAEAAEHLYALGPELATTKSAGDGGIATVRRKFDLDHMRTLCRALGNPERHFPSVLIAGTNGKGSTAATLATILNAAGYRTGLYTSPHLSRINERMQISQDGRLQQIADGDFAHLYTQVDDACMRLVSSGELAVVPSFFERVTAVAFLYFARPENRAEVVVLEVGLGGRLDATNVVDPLISILTDIALDHQEYLGHTLTEIAREKCGILRRHGTLITLPQHPEANQAIGEVATALQMKGINAAAYLPPARRNDEPAQASDGQLPRNAYRLTLAHDGFDEALQVDSPLRGQHQQRNLALAIAAAVELRNHHGYNISSEAMQSGILGTEWPGRLERLAPDLLVDVAHNPAGAWTLRAALGSLPDAQPRTLIFSCLRDKSLAEMSRILFPLFDSSPGGDPLRRSDHVVLAPIESPRAVPLNDLCRTAAELQVPFLVADDMQSALDLARRVTPPGGLIVATGSIYLVGEIRRMARGKAVVPA